MTNTVSRAISDEILDSIIQIESSGNPTVKAKTSSATGLFQFIDSTWLGTVEKHRPDVFASCSKQQLLARPADGDGFVRTNPSFAIEMGARHTEDNAKVLGSGWTAGDLYLAHFAGVGTAKKALQADPSTQTDEVFSANAIAANKSILQGKTCGEVRAWADRKMAGAGGRGWVKKFFKSDAALKADDDSSLETVHEAVAHSSLEPAWLVEARKLVGLKEIVGTKHEAKVVTFFAEAGHPEVKNDETAWCAAFANAMLRRSGYKGTGALNARSFLDWGDKLVTPRVGCIVVFWRGSRDGWQGHVAFYIDEDATRVKVLGGNQGNAVTIAWYAKDQLLGYRWPKDAAVVAEPKNPLPDTPEDTAALERGTRWIQESLNALIASPDLAPLEVDGELGPLTQARLELFQKETGLEPDGLPDPETIAEIERHLAKPAEGADQPAPRDERGRLDALDDNVRDFLRGLFGRN